MNRRLLLKSAPLLLSLPQIAKNYRHDYNRDDASIHWDTVKDSFAISKWDKLHLNSASAGVMPTAVQEYTIEALKYMNSKAPYEVWGEWQSIKSSNMKRLQEMIGAQDKSIEIVRNTTEALNMIISGIRMNTDDEVIISNNAYPFAVNAWKNKAIKEGIKIKNISYQLPTTDDDIINQYAGGINKNTAVIHITHMTHREGHIQPIERIIQLAHSKGIKVVVDGAHCVGQLALDLIELDIDYYASSLHKWLNAPHGTGLLYAKPELIETLYNHPSSYLSAHDKITKFEHIGTRAFHQEIGIHAALEYHDQIGIKPKMQRIQKLKKYWTSALRPLEEVRFLTNLSDRYSAAIATLAIDGYTGNQLVNILNRDYDIHIKSVSGLWGSGIRASVNIFHDYNDMDKFVAAIKDIVA